MINETLVIAYDKGISSLWSAFYFLLSIILFFVVSWLIGIYNKKKRRVIQIAKRNRSWRYKYPECPACKAIGAQGLKITRMGHLWCRSCRTQFTLERDENHDIKCGKSMGD